jgi:WD40 repeat protein
MIEITHYDISSHIVALAGPSAFNERNTVIVVKAIRSEEYIFATIIAGTAEIIALSPEGSFLATYTSDSIVRVWNASSKKLVLAEDHPGVSKLEVGEESLSMTFKSVSKIVKRSWEKGSSKHQEV